MALPEIAAGGDPGVQVWRDPEGRLVAIGLRRGAEFWVRVPRIGRFVFTSQGDRVGVLADAGVGPAALREHFYRSILPVAIQVAGREVLHASAVETISGVVAFAAPKESGKSTLAFAMSRRGYRLWAADAVVFELTERGATTHAIPFDLRLRPDPAAHFDRGRLVPVSLSLPSGAEPVLLEAAPLRAVVVLARAASGDAPASGELTRLRGSEAFTALLEQAYSFSLQDEARKKLMVEQYLGLVARIPVCRLRFATGLDHLPGLLRRLESFISELEAQPA